MKKKKKRKLLYDIILVIAAAVFLFSAFKIGTILYDYYLQDAEQDNLIEKANVGKDPEKEAFDIDWDALKKVNREIVAWILIPDTNISYPIVQGSDNDYYLTHTAEKKELYSGAVFMDYTATPDFSDRNTLVYGHNVLYGTMFAQLEKYKEESFFQKHPYVYIFTPDKSYRCEVLSFYTTRASSNTYITGIQDDVNYQSYIDHALSQSSFKSAYPITTAERMLTLSTCSYEKDGKPSDLRYALHAKFVEWTGTYMVDKK